MAANTVSFQDFITANNPFRQPIVNEGSSGAADVDSLKAATQGLSQQQIWDKLFAGRWAEGAPGKPTFDAEAGTVTVPRYDDSNFRDYLGLGLAAAPIAGMLAAPAAGAAAGAGATGLSEAALGELGINTALPAGSVGGIGGSATGLGGFGGSIAGAGADAALGLGGTAAGSSFGGNAAQLAGLEAAGAPASAGANLGLGTAAGALGLPTGVNLGAPPAGGGGASPAPTGTPPPGVTAPSPLGPGAAAATPTGAGAAAGTAGGGSFVDSLIKQMKDNALGLGLMGAGLAGAAKKPATLPSEQQLAGLGTDAANTARQLIQRYQSGNLTPGQQASLDELGNNTKNQLRQYFASIGQSDSTAAAQSVAQVDRSILEMKQQMLDNALTQGLNALGVSSQTLQSVANYQLGQDQQLRQAFGNFASGVGTLFGRQSGTQTAQSTTASPTITSVQKTG